ncbi:uncharacterized protein BDV17DRAFT_273986 [Aspergillus undulatus]|uniref:uncharacterized protein n=1 Tax=Aspergillus undulatus TaxID=1810928 RepID=UPI003CCE0975
MKTGCPNSTNFRRDRMLVSWPAVYIDTFGPSCTRSPITIRDVSRAVKLKLTKHSFPILTFAP